MLLPSLWRLSFAGALRDVALIGAILIAGPVHAQEGRRVTRPPDELLASFVQVYGTPGSAPDGDVRHVLTYPQDYPPDALQAFLQGLEHLALTADSSRVQAAATLSLAGVGSRSGKLNFRPSLPGMYARLERIYRKSNNAEVWGAVMAGMARVAERQQALTFLEQIAVQDPRNGGVRGSPEGALATLVAMGDDGRAVLKRLHETKAVRDPEARYRLSVLAGRGYRIR